MQSEDLGDLFMSFWRQRKSASPVGRGAITQEQYWVLKTLDKDGPMRVKDLAGTIGCTPGSASVAVKRLERAGLVRRQRNGTDERVVTVSLSPKGSQTVAARRKDQLRSIAGMFEGLSSEEKGTLRELLLKARNHWNSSRGVRAEERAA